MNSNIPYFEEKPICPAELVAQVFLSNEFKGGKVNLHF